MPRPRATLNRSQFWVSGAGRGGSGRIIIDALSATGASGSFTMNLVAGPGGSGTKTVTKGLFKITL